MSDYVKLSRKTWHYRLQKWVFGKENVPELNNLCPYFWLTIFCLIVTFLFPIVPLFKFLKFLGKLSNKGMDIIGNLLYDKWLNKIDAKTIDEIFSCC